MIVIGAFGLTVSAQTEKQIEAIKQIYKATNEKIAESEANGEFADTFLSEMVVNKNNGSYPAVGTFKTVYKFYYTYGVREKNPYPNRLMKVAVETNRAANTEKYEYFFNEKEQLIFYFESKNEGETFYEKRIYFQNEAVIKFLIEDKTQNLTKAETLQAAKNVLAEKRKLAGIFKDSLDY